MEGADDFIIESSMNSNAGEIAKMDDEEEVYHKSMSKIPSSSTQSSYAFS